MFVNVWFDDYTRFQDELKSGHLVKMRVRPPSGGFNTLTFESVPKNQRRKLPPKEEDPRLIVIKLPEKVEHKKVEVDLDEMKFDPNAISGLPT
jgi:hypothetical protein